MKIPKILFALCLIFNSFSQARPAATLANVGWSATGPGVGSIFTIVVNPLTPNVLFAGTVGGGIYKSSNSGQTWAAANSGVTDTIVYSVAVDPGVPGLVYAGTRDPTTTISGRVFKSTNSGATWTVSGLSSINYVNALAVDPKTPGTAYAGTYGTGVYKTIDQGDHWTPTGLTNAYVYALAIDPTTPGTIYAGTKTGLSKSIDGGNNWFPIFSDLNYIAVHAIAINPLNTQILYIGTLDPNGSGGPGGIFKSPDGGNTWAPTMASNPGPYIRSLAIDPTNPQTIYAGTGDPTSTSGSAYIYQTTNGGTNWNVKWGGPNNTTVLALAIDPSHSANIYAGIRRQGAIKSTNYGQNWSDSNAGLYNTYVYALAISPTDPKTILAGTWNGIYQTNNLGQTWTPVFVGTVDTSIHALAIDPGTPTTIYAGIGDPISSNILGGIQKSINGGANWSPSGLVGQVVNTLVINPNAPAVIYAGTGNGLYVSPDHGGTWNPMLCCSPVMTLIIDPTNNAILYAATSGAGVFKSIDGGNHWDPTNNGLGDTSYVNALVLDPTNSGILYAATGNRLVSGSAGGVYKSSDHGLTWNPAGLSSTRVYSLAISTSAPVTLFAGTSDSGVFLSQTGASDWQAMNTGLPAFGAYLPVNTLVIDPTSKATLLAGTDGSGSFAAQVPNPVPGLTSLSSDTLTLGSPGFTLTVTGTNFINGSLVKWGATSLATTFVSPTRLDAVVPTANLNAVGLVPITVENPQPGGGDSNPLTLTIQASMTITPGGGGQITFPDLDGQSMHVSVPAGAVTQTMTLLWIPEDGLDHGADALPAKYAYAGKSFILKVVVGGTPQDSFTFQSPLTLTIQYRPSDLVSIIEPLIKLFYWDGSDASWQDASCGQGDSHNLAQHTITVQICQTAEFGLLGNTGSYKTFIPFTHR